MLRKIISSTCLLVVALISIVGQERMVADALFPIEENDKKGFIDRAGRVVIPAQFDAVDSFSEGLALVILPRDPNNKAYVDSNRIFRYKKPPYEFAFIDTSGKVLFRVVFKGNIERYNRLAEMFPPTVGSFSEGLALVEINSYETASNGFAYDKTRYGFIDTKGNLAIEPDFDMAGTFSEGLARVKVESPLSFITWKYGYIDKDALFVIWPKFYDARDFSEGYAAVKIKDTSQESEAWGYIDRSGKQVIPFELDDAMGFSEGLASVKKNRVFYYITKMGQRAFSGDFSFADRFAEGLAAVNIGGKENENIQPHHVEGGKWGFIDKTGKIVITPKYEGARSFSGGLAAVNVGGNFSNRYELSGGKWGYVNSEGTLVIEPRFDEATDFTQGLARVKLAGRMAYINPKGTVIWQASK